MLHLQQGPPPSPTPYTTQGRWISSPVCSISHPVQLQPLHISNVK